MRNFTDEMIIFNAEDDDVTGIAQEICDFKFVMLTLSSANSADFVIKFQISNSNECPDFSAPRSVTNRWDYVQVRDNQDNAAIDGDTGVTFSGTDDVRRFEVTTSGQKWFCATITTYNAGNITLTAKCFSNQ